MTEFKLSGEELKSQERVDGQLVPSLSFFVGRLQTRT